MGDGGGGAAGSVGDGGGGAAGLVGRGSMRGGRVGGREGGGRGEGSAAVEGGLSVCSRGSEVTSSAPPATPTSSGEGPGVCSIWGGTAGSIFGCISVVSTQAAGFSVAMVTNTSVTLALELELLGADGGGREGGRGGD